MVRGSLYFGKWMRKLTFCCRGEICMCRGRRSLLPNIRRLTDAAARGARVSRFAWMFSCADDPEFKIFPPHCVKGTAGAELVPEALTDKIVRVPNDAEATLPADLSQ